MTVSNSQVVNPADFNGDESEPSIHVPDALQGKCAVVPLGFARDEASHYIVGVHNETDMILFKLAPV